MKKFLVILTLFVGCISFAQPLQPEPKPEIDPEIKIIAGLTQHGFEQTMVSAFKAGNATIIASYFTANIDLNIDGKNNLYSNKQGEQVLKNFFLSNKPNDFKIIHKGKSGKNEYFIGELTTSGKSFRVTINSKAGGSKGKEITSLTIEEN